MSGTSRNPPGLSVRLSREVTGGKCRPAPCREVDHLTPKRSPAVVRCGDLARLPSCRARVGGTRAGRSGVLAPVLWPAVAVMAAPAGPTQTIDAEGEPHFRRRDRQHAVGREAHAVGVAEAGREHFGGLTVGAQPDQSLLAGGGVEVPGRVALARTQMKSCPAGEVM